MSPTRVSIDLAQSPLKVGGLLLGKFFVDEGTKGVRVIGTVRPNMKEFYEALTDARQVVKSCFGASNFDAAVIVFPNYTSHSLRQDIRADCQASAINITQFIDERLAVAMAYGEKIKPTTITKLAIISISSGIIDISIISIVPNDQITLKYEFILHSHAEHTEPIDFEKNESAGGGLFGLVEGAVETLVVDPFEEALDLLKDLLGNIDIGEGKVDRVVMVGKAAKSDKLQQAVKERFDIAEVWPEIGEAKNMAAFGAAVISYYDAEPKVTNFCSTI